MYIKLDCQVLYLRRQYTLWLEEAEWSREQNEFATSWKVVSQSSGRVTNGNVKVHYEAEIRREWKESALRKGKWIKNWRSRTFRKGIEVMNAWKLYRLIDLWWESVRKLWHISDPSYVPFIPSIHFTMLRRVTTTTNNHPLNTFSSFKSFLPLASNLRSVSHHKTSDSNDQMTVFICDWRTNGLEPQGESNSICYEKNVCCDTHQRYIHTIWYEIIINSQPFALSTLHFLPFVFVCFPLLKDPCQQHGKLFLLIHTQINLRSMDRCFCKLRKVSKMFMQQHRIDLIPMLKNITISK